MVNKIPFLLQKVSNTYRPYDPGQYLYKLMFNSYKNHFNTNFLDLTYTTLIAWNMNHRGAKLSSYDDFINSIKSNVSEFKALEKLSIEKNEVTEKEIKVLKKLFKNLKLVQQGKPKLVTYAKTLHFLLPTLLMPIDRKYTLEFFYQNTSIPKNEEIQFQMYCDILKQYQNLANNISLKIYLDEGWNKSIPKIIDNLIIAYQKSRKT